jgi:hypothetical protein
MLYNIITFINNILLTCRAVRLGVLHGEHKRQCECGFECDSSSRSAPGRTTPGTKPSVSVGASVGIFYCTENSCCLI